MSNRNILIGDTSFINLPIFTKGKVRDVYDLGENLLMVATDRISAFDVVFRDLIPNKGKVLNSISSFWFNYTKGIVDNHMVTSDFSEYPKILSQYKEQLEGRSMIVKKLKMINVECIVRGYLEGSGLKDYNKTGCISGIKLPNGLKQGERLPEPIFTPSTKATSGHDENITYEEMKSIIGEDLARKIKDISIELYNRAYKHALNVGIILADTKLEFGILNNTLVVADEMFTPDSSRFWDASEYEAGKPQKSFDKQYLRDYLEAINWDKNSPAPKLPIEIIKNTEAKYNQAYKQITGNEIR